MKVKYILKDNVYIIGYQSYPEPAEAAENEIIIANPAEDLMQNYLWYKIIKGKPVKMDEREFYEVHPECRPQEPTQTDAELSLEMVLDLEERVTTIEMMQGGEI